MRCTGATEFRHLCAKQADRTGPEDQDTITGPNATVHAHRVVGDAARLRQSRFFKRQRGGDAMEAAFRHPDVLGHGPIHAIAEATASGIEIIKTAAAERGASSMTAAVSLTTRSPS